MEQKIQKSNILLPLLEASYRKEYTEWPRRNLRCSDAGAGADAGDKCEREIYYDFKFPDMKTSLTTGSLVLFDDGRIHEGDIRRRLSLVLRSPEKEVFDPETGAKGKLDNTVYFNKIQDGLKEAVGEKFFNLLTNDHDGALDPVLELKSVNEFQFKEMGEGGYILQHYYDQVQYYLLLTGRAWALILIKNRNNFGIEKGSIPYLEFMIFPDAERQKEIRKGLMIVKETVEQSVLPPRPFKRGSSKCSYCRFKKACWGDEAPAFAMKPDETIEKPSQEMLESAVRVYKTTSEKLKELEATKDEAGAVIKRFFKATAEKELIVDKIKASCSQSTRSYIDAELLKEKIGAELYIKVSMPNAKLLDKAIEDREIDARLVEEATKQTAPTITIRVSAIKEKEAERVSKPEAIKKELPKKEKAVKGKKKNGKKKNGKKKTKKEIKQ